MKKRRKEHKERFNKLIREIREIGHQEIVKYKLGKITIQTANYNIRKEIENIMAKYIQ